tara:strand:- start:74131 stop:74988 length:858 start_codon:yes stop_codon:yes gene_type:complete
VGDNTCLVCESELTAGYKSWHLLCKNCGYEKANLQQTINSHLTHQLIDENAREKGLRELRKSNFTIIAEKIKSLKPNGGSLLDVGCAHGWFIETVGDDFEVLGLEPDKRIFEKTSRRNLAIRMGYFPQALGDCEKFDVIVFNDVIEHIPDIKRTLAYCHEHLNDDGLLVLNLPSNNGVAYCLSKIFCKFGLPKFFYRLWQKGFPSPHLHYFNLPNLTSFLESNKFNVKTKGTLPTIRLNGLYPRISYDRRLGRIVSAFICIGVALLLPILRFLPNDIVYVVAKKA